MQVSESLSTSHPESLKLSSVFLLPNSFQVLLLIPLPYRDRHRQEAVTTLVKFFKAETLVSDDFESIVLFKSWQIS